MKKILLSTFAAVTATAAFAIQAVAAAPSVTVGNDRSDTEYTYTAAEGSKTAAADAAKLFGGLAEASAESYTFEELTVTSESKNAGEIKIALRFSCKDAADNSVLNYYDLKIADENGEIVYNSEDADTLDADALEKEITLGVFNVDSDAEVRKYAVGYKINAELADRDVSGLEMKLVSSAVNPDAADADFEVTAAAAAAPVVTAEPADTEIETVVAAAASRPVEEETIEFTKTCGVDITAGRYVVTGRGTVKITGADGSEKSETVVTDDTDAISGSVDSFIASIVDGDVITVLPLEGDEKPSVRFAKTNTGAASAPGSAVAGAVSSEEPTQTPAANKANPRTGETTRAALFGGLMLAAGAGIAALELIKRRKTANK